MPNRYQDREPFRPYRAPRFVGPGLEGDHASAGRGREVTIEPLVAEDVVLGPPGLPRPFEASPHEDLGDFWSDLFADIQGVGEVICTVLDGPPEGLLGIEGPHRLVDRSLDTVNGMFRSLERRITQREG